eukprot:5423618-Pleurochrysis_carterae.AAC.4
MALAFDTRMRNTSRDRRSLRVQARASCSRARPSPIHTCPLRKRENESAARELEGQEQCSARCEREARPARAIGTEKKSFERIARVARDQPENLHGLVLADAVGAGHRLRTIARFGTGASKTKRAHELATTAAGDWMTSHKKARPPQIQFMAWPAALVQISHPPINAARECRLRRPIARRLATHELRSSAIVRRQSGRACTSFCGFQSESKMMHVSAAVRLMPRPPDQVCNRQT